MTEDTYTQAIENLKNIDQESKSHESDDTPAENEMFNQLFGTMFQPNQGILDMKAEQENLKNMCDELKITCAQLRNDYEKLNKDLPVLVEYIKNLDSKLGNTESSKQDVDVLCESIALNNAEQTHGITYYIARIMIDFVLCVAIVDACNTGILYKVLPSIITSSSIMVEAWFALGIIKIIEKIIRRFKKNYFNEYSDATIFTMLVSIYIGVMCNALYYQDDILWTNFIYVVCVTKFGMVKSTTHIIYDSIYTELYRVICEIAIKRSLIVSELWVIPLIMSSMRAR